jgi:fatty acid desaturase
MLFSDYRFVAQRLSHDGLLRPSAIKSIAALLLCIAVTLIACRLITVRAGFGYQYVLGELILAFCFYQYFVIMHECGHRSFLKGRWSNVIIGSLAGCGCLIPFETWARLHMLHHRWVGVVDMDPTQAHVLSHRAMGRLIQAGFRLVWKLRIPIPMIQFVALVFWVEPFKSLRSSGSRQFILSLSSMIFTLVPQVFLVVYLGWWHYVLWVGPATVIYFAIFELINLPQHSGMFPHTSKTHPKPIPIYEQEEITRTSQTQFWVSRYILLHFNLHSEHHLFPSAPWHALPEISTILREVDGLRLQDVSLMEFNSQMRAKDPVKLFLTSMPDDRQAVSTSTHRDRIPPAEGGTNA